jgi:hypothetical protein
MSATVLVAVAFWSVTLVLTVSVAGACTVKVCHEAFVLSKVIELTGAEGVAATVIESPARITTSSAGPGTPAGFQVPAVFQSPLPVLVLVAARLGSALSRLAPRASGTKAFRYFIGQSKLVDSRDWSQLVVEPTQNVDRTRMGKPLDLSLARNGTVRAIRLSRK